MNLITKQDEFSDLLFIDSIERKTPSDELFTNLSEEDRLLVAASWVSDGVHARHIDYPRNSREVQYFRQGRAPLLRGLFNVAACLQLVFTFFDVSQCDYIRESYGTSFFRSNGTPTRLCLTCFDMVCVCIYLYDLFLKFAINPSSRAFIYKPWSTFRLLITLFILCDCVYFFFDPGAPRIMRCIFPFMLISRRNNLKLMCQGLIVSIYKALPVVKALFSLLVVWGFVGFIYFRSIDSNRDV